MKMMVSIVDRPAEYSGHEHWLGYLTPGGFLTPCPDKAAKVDSLDQARAVWSASPFAAGPEHIGWELREYPTGHIVPAPDEEE